MPINSIHEIVLFIARQPAESDIVMASPSVRPSLCPPVQCRYGV